MRRQSSFRADEKLRLRVLAPVLLGLIAVTGTAVVGIHMDARHSIERQGQARLSRCGEVFANELEHDRALMLSALELLQSDAQLLEAWQRRDRRALLSRAAPQFARLRKARITHFYFIDTARVCFLRVHNPDRHGDTIDRITAREAEQTRAPSCGIELGRFGTFTLRCVVPWTVNDELVGYVELGEEIEHITPRVARTLGVDLLLTIDKQHLDRALWAEGLRMTGRTGNWDQYVDEVLIDGTKPALPRSVLREVIRSESRDADAMAAVPTDDGAEWQAGHVPLVDAGGHELGRITMLHDVTHETAAAQAHTNRLTWLATGIGLFVSLLMYVYLGVIQRLITNGRTRLEEELTIRRIAEEQLQSTLTELAHQNEVLAEARDEARSASRAKSEFLSTVSHELRTPLNGILGMSELLVSTDLTEEQLDYAVEVTQAGVRLLRLIENVLTFSDVESGRFRSCPIVFRLPAMLHEVLESFREAAANKQLVLRGELPPDLPASVEGDAGRIRQVLDALLDNAIRFTDQGEVVLAAEVTAEAADVVHLRFDVRDTGVGIAPTARDQVFGAFFQEDGSNTRQVDGAGMGLAACQQLIRVMGGRIGVEPEPEGGSRFWFTLPLRRVSDAALTDDSTGAPIDATTVEGTANESGSPS